MATADVYIPEALATSLQPKGEFFNTVKIPTADFKTKTDTDVPADVDKEYFVLDSEHFVALQLYLLAAAHLPSSKETFTQTYPEQLFDPHYKRDPNPPPLYEVIYSCISALVAFTWLTRISLRNQLWLTSTIIATNFPAKR